MDLCVCRLTTWRTMSTTRRQTGFWRFTCSGCSGRCCSVSQRETRCRGTCSPRLRRSGTHPSIRCPISVGGSAVLAATYRGLCSAVSRPASKERILLGCPLLLQMWIHERCVIGRPKADLSEYQTLPEDTNPVNLPTMGSLWCLWKLMTPLSFSSRYEFFSSIHLTFHVLCCMFGLGSSQRRRTRTS
jgi:hypothetical protein